ncbi:MAG: 2-amino-4-hydroxy-6-hydroxymethyldihydropteridine diphosphokinase [Chloroflexi bacterium]|nr:2-amino-4-hydroxy-6-hydroxymethyldihydropteridine diphosphokinase [Chloroflexota bacterium]
MSHIIYLGLGTNLGDRQANLQAAVAGLIPKVGVLRVSSVYETEPWGYRDQPACLNQVLEGETDLKPLDLLVFLKNLELTLGRQATFLYGPRLIDLDILFYDQAVINQPELVIPHPRLAERAFMLVPLTELAPELRHPLLGLTISMLKNRIDTSGVKLVI